MGLESLLNPLIPHVKNAEDTLVRYAGLIYGQLCAVEQAIVYSESFPLEDQYLYYHNNFTAAFTDVEIGQVPHGDLWEIQVATWAAGPASSDFFVHKETGIQRIIFAHQTASSVAEGETVANLGILVPGGETLYMSSTDDATGGQVYLQIRKYHPGDRERKYEFRTGRSAERFTGMSTHDMRDALVRDTPQAPAQGD